jgi:hypothetical protein
MSPARIVAASALLLLVGVQCTTETDAPDSLTVKETLRIGTDDPEAPNHRLFSNPAEVAMGDDSLLFVADGQEAKVRVYDDSTYRFSIGEEGNGPGEFRQIAALHVDRRNRLLVADRRQARITAFTQDGDLLATYQLPDVPRIGEIADLSTDRYAVVGPGDEHLVHVVDTSFSTVHASFVAKSEITATDHKLETVTTQFFPGSVAVPDPNTIVYAPALYTGTLHAYERSEDGSWTQTDTYEGRARHQSPVTFSSIDQAERVDLPIRLQSGPQAAQFHTLSWALDAGGDGALAHVFMQENDDALELTLERFSADGSFLNTAVIDTTSSLTLEALAVDATGTLYLSDRREVPQLRRLSWRPTGGYVDDSE